MPAIIKTFYNSQPLEHFLPMNLNETTLYCTRQNNIKSDVDNFMQQSIVLLKWNLKLLILLK
jgi:hypothetical protein